MVNRAVRDNLDHGWTRAALADPPPWGVSIPDEFQTVELNFYRRTGGATNNIGGFKGQASADNYLVINGVAELRTDSGFNNTVEAGPFVRRHYDILIDIPEDLAALPKKGDRVWWYDRVNRRIDVPLRSVDVPEGSKDHLEIESEEFE